jgi:predicted permease
MTVLLVDQGFQPRGALGMQFTLPASRYATPQARLDFHTRLLERLRTLPVEAAGLAVTMPNRQPSGRFDYNPVGAPIDGDPLAATIAEVRTVSEGFFEAMGMPLLSGRGFRAEDGPGAESVMVISDRLARQHFPDRPAVGQMLYSGTGDRRVVGVVGDVRPAAAGVDPGPAAYLPLRQDALTLQWFASATLVVRGREAAGQAGEFRELLRSLDADVVPYNVRTLSDEVGRLVATPRFSAALLAAFAIVALVLAMVGVYGVLGYVTAQRTHEMGVRVALGATPGGVRALVLRDAAWILGGGLVLGLTAAIWLARGLAGLLHDTAPADPAALAAVAGLLAGAGFVAAWLPARRATRINVLEALRHD